MQLQSNVAYDPATGRYDPFREGSRIYLTLPSGERVGFTFTAQLHVVAGLKYYTPGFVADPGVAWSLALDETKLNRVGDRYYDLLTSRPFNPEADSGAPFELTAPDGTVYNLNYTGGTRKITFTDGVALSVSDSGIVAANGDTLSFIGGRGGEIGGVITPAGEGFIYTYDDRGLLQSVRDLAHAASLNYGYADGDHHKLVLAAGQHGDAISYGATPQVTSIKADLGAAISYLAAPHDGILSAGGADLYSFTVRESEIAGTAGGSVYLGVVVTATPGSGLAPAIPTIAGLTPTASSVNGNSAFALFKIDAAGLRLLRIAGVDAASAGGYSIEFFIAGDANRDAKVDGVDAALLEAANGSVAGQPDYKAAIDFNRDGRIDSTDRQLLFQDVGYAANLAPTVATSTFLTHKDLSVVIPVQSLISDPEGDIVFFHITGVTHGTARLSGDGLSVIFTPDAGYAGAASFTIVADDGTSTSSPVTETVNVSDARLLAIDFLTRKPQLAIGETQQLQLVGDFEDQLNVLLPGSYVNLVSTNTDAAIILDGGILKGVGFGYGVIVATRANATAATVFNVGQLEDDFAVSTDVFPDAVSLSSDGGTRQIKLFTDPTDMTSDVAAALNGTRYWISNSDVIEVTPDGKIIAKAPGEAIVTVIYKNAEALVPVKVFVPQIGPTALTTEGGVVRSIDGYQVAIAPGSLNKDTTVEIQSVARDQLEAPIPPDGLGWTFGAAFKLKLNGATNAIPMQLALPTTLAAGTPVLFYRLMTLPDGNGGLIKVWMETESGFVDENGIARTTSPPEDGIMADGTFMMAGVDSNELGKVNGKVTVSGAGDKGGLYAVVTSIAGAFIGTLVNVFASFGITLPFGAGSVTLMAIKPDGGLDKAEFGVEVKKGVLNSFNPTIFTKVDDPKSKAPIITSAQVLFLSRFSDSHYSDPDPDAKNTGIEPILQLKGTNFIPDKVGEVPEHGSTDNGHDGKTDDRDHVWVIFGNGGSGDDLATALKNNPKNLPVIELANAIAVRAEFVSADEIDVRIPISVAIGSVPIRVVQIVHDFNPAPGKKETDSQHTGLGVNEHFDIVAKGVSQKVVVKPTAESTFVAVANAQYGGGR